MAAPSTLPTLAATDAHRQTGERCTKFPFSPPGGIRKLPRQEETCLTQQSGRWIISFNITNCVQIPIPVFFSTFRSIPPICFVPKERKMSTGGHRRLDIEEVGDVTVAKFIDKKILDETNIQIIGNQLFGLVDEDGRDKIVLDFSNVEYLSSAALGKLITMDKKVKAAKGKLRLCSIRPDIYEVFAITKLNKLFVIDEDQEKSLASF
jgi:anti-sigma B factor antagonist